MRRATQEDLQPVSAMMVEQFWGKEELQLQFAGIPPATAKPLAEALVQFELAYYLAQGDILVYDSADGTPAGAIVGCDSRALSIWRRLAFSLRGSKVLRAFPKEELALVQDNAKAVSAVHSRTWFRRYCRTPYYIAQFGVCQPHRGTGAARELLEGMLGVAAARHDTVILETFSRENVPMYLHFGFFLKQVYTCGAFTEYRLIKYLPQA